MAELQLLQSELPQLRGWLTNHLQWRHYDFIREPEQFAVADGALCVDELLRPLPPEDDLRFGFADRQGDTYIFAERLPWDSNFFGYQVARLNTVVSSSPIDLTTVLTAFVAEASRRNIRYLFARVFPEDLTLLQGLTHLGFTLIETRVLYHMPLMGYAFPERFAVRSAEPRDVATLQQTAREAINAYDRFHADPFIAPTDADRLMEAWVAASVERGFADVTLIPDCDVPHAFTTVRYNRERWERWGYKVAQTVLSAVSPACRGWHKKLVSETNYHLQQLGIQHAVLPTQLTNRAVLHNLEQLGYRYGRSEHIFRILL